jgi:hypothetical protein
LSNIPSDEIVDLLFIAKNEMKLQYQSFSFNEKGEAQVVFYKEQDAEAF